MKKINVSYCLHWQWRKLLLIMKLVWIFILAGMFVANAKTFSQNVRLDLKTENASLKSVLSQIEEKTDYYFFYKNEELENFTSITVDAKQELLSELLDNILKNKGFEYEVHDHYILIQKASENGSFMDLMQQQKSVAGKVTDSTGAPLPGVSVVIKSTTKGVITDTNGSYSIANVPANAILVFSFVGMKTQEVSVTGKININISMQEEAVGIEEVVAVGYGTQSKGKLTSAVSTLKTKEFLKVPYENVGTALAGRIAGVIIQSSGGEPGSFPSVSIRGGDDPLYVIDGIVRDKTAFMLLSKEDVSSVSVLKDASATAVYGARAANGIIQVTTKQGTKGEKFQISYNSNFAWNTPTRKLDLISSYNKAKTANAMAEAEGLGLYSRYSEAILDTIQRGLNSSKYPNTNWYKTVMRNYAPQREQSLSVSGGNQSTKYYLGLGMLNQGSSYVNNAAEYKRYTYRSNITTSFDKIGLDVSLNLNGYIKKAKYPPFSARMIFSHIVAKSPLEKPYNTDGTLSALVDHPLAEIESPGYEKNNNYYNNGSLVFSWAVPWIKGLTVKALGDYAVNSGYQNTFTAYKEQYDELGILRSVSAPSLSLYNELGTSYNYEGHIDYQLSFGQHNIGATFVTETSGGNTNWTIASRKDFFSTAVDQLFAGSSKSMTNNGNSAEYGRLGYIGRVKYDFKNKYFVELSGRYDGSDNFPKIDNKRWGFFPAISMGWNISEESFFIPLKEKNIFNLFKLRGSAGVIGNDNLARFAYLSTYNLNSQIFVTDGNLVNGFSEGDLVSNNLSWYTTKSYDLGFDFTSFRNHLSGSFDYFYNRTTGYLTSPRARYVDPLGKSLPQIKSDAAYRKAGIDASLSYSNSIRDFSYQIGANITSYNSLWEKANEDSITNVNPYVRSQGVLESYYGSMYTSAGFYQSFDDVLNYPRRISSSSLAPGDIRYQDTNKDGKIDGQDFRRIGNNSSPRLVFGFTLSGEYKGFSINALIQGTGRRDIYIGDYLQAREENRVNFGFQADYWTSVNTNAKYPRAANSNINSSNNYSSSNFWLLDASYIRLKSLSLAYDLKKVVLKNYKWINSFSVYVSGTNLLTRSACMKYFDPETADASNFGYPVNKTYSLGFNLSF